MLSANLLTMDVFLLLRLCSLASALAPTTSIPLLRVPKFSVSTALPVMRQADSISMEDIKEYTYLANISIGKQTLPVIIDTGSYDLWVVSTNCSTPDYPSTAKYSPSPTLAQTNTSFNLKYLAGGVEGMAAYETVQLDHYEITGQVFGMANYSSGAGVAGAGNSGIMGLSFSKTASIPLSLGKNLVSNVMDHMDEANKFFSIRLGHEGEESTLTLGGHNPAMVPLLSRMTIYDVVSASGNQNDYWKIPLAAMVTGAQDTPLELSRSKISGSKQQIAVFDTGTTLILGPSTDVRNLWIRVGGAEQRADGTWEVRCNVGIRLGFVFGNTTYYVDPSDSSWGDGDTSGVWCTAGIQSNDNVYGGDWLLGDAFLRNVYISHYLGANNSAPKVGLVGLTDPESSMDRFQATRGGLLVNIPATIFIPWSSPFFSTVGGQTVSIVLAMILGMLLSAAATLVFKIKSRTPRAKYNRLNGWRTAPSLHRNT